MEKWKEYAGIAGSKEEKMYPSPKTPPSIAFPTQHLSWEKDETEDNNACIKFLANEHLVDEISPDKSSFEQQPLLREVQQQRSQDSLESYDDENHYFVIRLRNSYNLLKEVHNERDGDFITWQERQGALLKSGLAIRRSWADIQHLDHQIHQEFEERSLDTSQLPELLEQYGIVGSRDLDSYLVQLLAVKEAAQSESFASFLRKGSMVQQQKPQGKRDTDRNISSEYDVDTNDNSLIEPQEVSVSTSSFQLANDKDTNKENALKNKKPRPRLYLDYLLQYDMDMKDNPQGDGAHHDVSERSMIMAGAPRTLGVPRRGIPCSYITEAVPPGWWIVWQLRLVPKQPYTFPISSLNIKPPIPPTAIKHQLDVSLSFERKKESPLPVETDHEESQDEDMTIPLYSPQWKEEIVHNQRCSLSGADVCQGSYRFHTDLEEEPTDGAVSMSRMPTRAKLTFKSVGPLSLVRGCQIQVECAAVPHEAFRAACKAAHDQNEADDRRENAPLLSRILDWTEREHNHTDDTVKCFNILTVEPWMKDSTFIEDDATVDSRNASNEGPDENLDPEERSDETSSESDEDFEVSENITVLQEKLNTNMRILGDREKDIESLKVELTSTQADRERLHAEVTRLSELEEDSRRKIRLVHSERRVWNIAREEIRSELMRLYERVDTEYRLRLKAETDLSQSFREKREMQKELACLKVALAQYNINDHSGKEPHNDIQMLLEQINSLRSRNKLLEETVKKPQNESFEDVLTMALSDPIDSQLTQNEQIGGNALEESQSWPQLHDIKALDQNINEFVHPDARLNARLSELRNRYATLIHLLEMNPSNSKNVTMARKIEETIRKIVASA